MLENEKNLLDKLAELEGALSKERTAREALQIALETEARERKEALLWQEHRVLSALRSVYQYRNDPDLRWAALGGMTFAFLSRSSTTALAAGGLFAVVLTVLIALHANYLLAIQNERMDVQTIVVDAQRRSQNFQGEFAAIAADTSTQISAMRGAQITARNEFVKQLRDIAKEALSKTTDHYNRTNKLKDLSAQVNESDSRFQKWYKGRNLDDDEVEYFLYEISLIADEIKRDPDESHGWDMSEAISDATFSYLNQRNIKWLRGTGKGHLIPLYRLDGATASRVAGLSRTIRPYPELVVKKPDATRILPEGLLGSLSQYALETLLGRVGSGARAQNTNWVIDLAENRTSWERGQLLTFLIAQGIWLEDVFDAGADFSFVDLSLRTIGPAHLSNAKLMGASFSRSRIIDVIMNGDFRSADFRCAEFGRSNLEDADLAGALFTGATFNATFKKDPQGGESLNETQIRERDNEHRFTILSPRNLADADFSGAQLAGTVLQIPWLDVVRTIGTKETAGSLGELLQLIIPDRPDLVDRYQKVRVSRLGSPTDMAVKWNIGGHDQEAGTEKACP